MRYDQLGRSGLNVSKLALGTMVFGWKTPADEAFRIVDRALDEGINLIDTSNSYGRGRSEEIVGEALARNRRRNAVILATKFHHRMDENDVNSSGNGRRNVIHSCEASLRRLGTDRIDLYQVHRPQSSVPIDETLRALDDLRRAGKIVYAGTSNFAAWELVDAHWAARAGRTIAFVSEQGPYNLLDRSIELEILPAATQFGIGVIAFSPLAEGILSGKYRRGQELPPDSRYAKVDKPGMYRERLTAPVFDVVEGLERLAQRRATSISAFALAWLASRPGLSSIIVGPSTERQLIDNLNFLGMTLTDEEYIAIDTLAPRGSVVSPYRIMVTQGRADGDRAAFKGSR